MADEGLLNDLCTIMSELLQKKDFITISVDGDSAAGKTALSKRFCERFNANCIHMDDFFLPPELRTDERLSQPGGNVHYERFKSEVVPHLPSREPFVYGTFDCSKMAVTKYVCASCRRITVVEGVYSRHPSFGEIYDLKIFMRISPEQQYKRILRRNGEKMAERFIKEWIPMEKRYFDAYQIGKNSDIVIDAD